LDEKGYKFYMTLAIDNIYVKKDFKFANVWEIKRIQNCQKLRKRNTFFTKW
jgi:hypothetical protein